MGETIEPVMRNAAGPVMIISSDGHAVARMPDYREYLPAGQRDDFDEFLKTYAKDGSRSSDSKSLANRLDKEEVERWIKEVEEPGRLEGQGDPHKRLRELDREGIAAEVLFPDFGLAFELYSPFIAALTGFERTPGQVEAANTAHNRWLADFCSVAPERFAGLAVLTLDDIEASVKEIRWAREAGLKGIVLPKFSDDRPVFHERFEPVWAVLEELDFPVAVHTSISSITNVLPVGTLKAAPHPSISFPVISALTFFQTQQLLTHLIWGGVLERHPRLRVVMTETGTGWIVSALKGLDYSWEQSYLRRDVRELVPRRPSEYYQRQVYMGSSIFSRAEAEARDEVGIGKILIGMDYPHHEGTWAAGPGTLRYLQATLGAAGVPAPEARLMLGENAAGVYGLDVAALAPTVARMGWSIDEILAVPDADYFPRGDVNKPLATAL